MKILITGGAGFIGSHIVERLMIRHEVSVLDDFSTGFASQIDQSRVQVIEGSVVDSHLVHSLDQDWDSIIHLAAESSVPESFARPREFLDVNTEGTINMLQLAASAQSHFVLASSASVYGRNEESTHSEHSWTQPLSPYAASKLAAEGMAFSFAEQFGLSVAVCRFFNVFGPRQRPDHPYAAVVPRFASQALRGQPLTVFGDGEQTRDLVSVGFVCDVLTFLCESRQDVQAPIPIATGLSVSILELAQRVLALSGSSSRLHFLPPRQGEVRHSKGDPGLLLSLMPSAPVADLDSSLDLTLDWMDSTIKSIG